MPLLGKKVYALSTQTTNKGTDEAPYLIPHTKERFQSKDEYEKRKELYAQNIWTCRATGHTSLTHEEACDSEKEMIDQVKSEFPKCFEKEVLSQVHHSTSSLDILVDKTWYGLHQQFVIGEKVHLRVTVANKTIPAKIVSIDKAAYELKNGTSACNSPSSDKENSSDEKDTEKSKKKGPPKFLPYTYSIELENEAKIIHSVPAADLVRVQKAPSKDLVRLFIRVSAIRSSTCATSPWVVNSDLVKEYKLVSKFADFFLSPMKMSEAAKQAEKSGKKRKLSSQDSKVSKKLKLDKSAEKKKDKKDKSSKSHKKDSLSEKKKDSSSEKKKDSSSEKKKDSSSAKKKSSEKKKESSSEKKKESSSEKKKESSSEKKKESSSEKKKVSSSEKKNVLKKNKDSNKNESIVVEVSDSDDDISLAEVKKQITPKKNKVDVTPKKNKIEVTPKKKKVDAGSASDKVKKSTPKKNTSKLQKQNESTPTKKGSKSTKEQKDKKKGLKQVTLYDLTKKGKKLIKADLSTPQKKSPVKKRPPPTPLIVKNLLSAKRETMKEKVKWTFLIKKAVDILTPTQVKNLPPHLKEEYDKRKSINDEKKKLAKMTDEEKEAYLKEKRREMKEKQKEKMGEKMKEQRKRFEDTELTLTPLPTPKLVNTPDAFPNELFGDVAMITEFLNCFGGLLMPNSEYPIYSDALMKALVGGPSGFTYLSRVLTVLLQTLLQDNVAEAMKEVNTKLSDITVNSYTASELVRLCLQPMEDDFEDENSDRLEKYVESLKDTEFYQLDLEPKLVVLKALCLRVLDTNSIQDYLEDQQKTASKLTKQKIQEEKQKAAELKAQKQKEQKANETAEKVGDTSVGNTSVSKDTSENASTESDKAKEADKGADNGADIRSFYGKDSKEAEDSSDEGKDWSTIFKNRRVQAAKAAAEKEKMEKERAKAREIEYQEERRREAERKQKEQLNDAINLARMVLRQEPIGTDRNHDRYWVFTNTTPGLYVEKGWIGDVVHYSTAKSRTLNMSKDDSSDEEMDSNDRSGVEQTGSTPLKVKYAKKKHLIESSLPKNGQNLWFTFKSQKDLDGLLKSLHPQGIRESLLKTEIKKRYDDLNRAIIQSQRTSNELRTSDGDKEMLDGFKTELSDMELRLRNGGLGGVDNFEDWEDRLMETDDVTVLAKCLQETKENVMEKFRQGFMKPVVKTEEEVKEDDSETEVEETENDKEDSDKPAVVKETKEERAMREWNEAVEDCQSISRLHVLLAVLDTCIKWEKSAENAKCKICRKKTNDDQLLLCDECNQAFHMYCLRPSLTRLPTGDWFCQACKPKREETRNNPLDSDSEEEEEKEDSCRLCEGTDKLITCSTCPAAWHLMCHEPPLRHPPRGEWECTDCKEGVTRRRGRGGRGKRNSRKAAPKKEVRKKYAEVDTDADEESEEETVKPGRGKGRNTSSKRAAPKKGKRKHAEVESEEEEDSEEEEVVKPSRGRKRGPPKKRKIEESESEEEEEESEEEEEVVKPSSSSRGRRSGSAKIKTPQSSNRTARASKGQKDTPVSTSPPSRTSRRGPSEISICEDILGRIMKNKLSWPFIEPVDKKEVPDYYVLIKKPMDFLTMQRKCARLSYATPQEFIEDAALVFENAESYNTRDSEVFDCMLEVEKSFKEMLNKALPDWPYYRTVVEKADDASIGNDTGRRRSRK